MAENGLVRKRFLLLFRLSYPLMTQLPWGARRVKGPPASRLDFGVVFRYVDGADAELIRRARWRTGRS